MLSLLITVFVLSFFASLVYNGGKRVADRRRRKKAVCAAMMENARREEEKRRQTGKELEFLRYELDELISIGDALERQRQRETDGKKRITIDRAILANNKAQYKTITKIEKLEG